MENVVLKIGRFVGSNTVGENWALPIIYTLPETGTYIIGAGIAPGGSTTLTVCLDSSTNGLQPGLLYFGNNDTNG